MSTTRISNLRMDASLGFPDFPSYSERIGTPVFLSTELDTCSPASASPLKPCSGEKMATTLNLFSSRMSSRCLSPIIPVWLENMAIRLSFRIGKYSEVCSSPKITRSSCARHSKELHSTKAKSSSFFIIVLLRRTLFATKIRFILISKTLIWVFLVLSIIICK